MASYVDNVAIEWRGNTWCHLVADSLDELHNVARRLGLKKEWFQANASYPHYDVTSQTRARALELGVLTGNRRQIIQCARALKNELASVSKAPAQLELFS
ncbi:DUF4031 domain-containing protein [Rugamonas sp. DEMB1]|uniref:DUF4031 domain-containing protein n=1 Tax=Rugamonas sp. DEMB1 TaxID=3039386 RepID=UPI002448EF92|nr:DUF4031 domain-containing protein [Rugamonas sp. DEMB1]WGG50468.1 DUF4031 domain-containing protein [Rugamonas sp. DEMB1]